MLHIKCHGTVHKEAKRTIYRSVGMFPNRNIICCSIPQGELFAAAKLTEYPSPVIEPVSDSSRYFAMMIENEQGMGGGYKII